MFRGVISCEACGPLRVQHSGHLKVGPAELEFEMSEYWPTRPFQWYQGDHCLCVPNSFPLSLHYSFFRFVMMSISIALCYFFSVYYFALTCIVVRSTLHCSVLFSRRVRDTPCYSILLNSHYCAMLLASLCKTLPVFYYM